LSVFVLESMPSGVGEPVCEVDCDEGGDGRLKRNWERGGGISGGGEGELAGELKGEESTLEGGEESGLESPESVSAAMLGVWRETAGERAAEGVEWARECYRLSRIVQAAVVEGGETREFRVGCGRVVWVQREVAGRR
jgi:hypothetical protein